MHELSATQSILEIALTEASRHGAATIERIHVKVGKWSTFEPECLKFYFNIIALGTQAEGTDLSIESIPVLYACDDCGTEYTPDSDQFSCPKCSCARNRLINGREFFIESIEVR